MTSKSKIEWTEVTWNPVTGCSKVSEGCLNCYAERMSKRLKAMKNKRYENEFKVTIHRDLFEEPLKWKKSRIIFVNSMSDLFHSDVPDDDILKIFEVMNKAKHHIFQVLTKREDRLLELSKKIKWTDNIWMGVTVESDKYFKRIEVLRKIDSKIKFLSCEPLLGSLKGIDLNGIDWVIVGGESGPGAREMKEEWAINLLESSRKYKTKFFFKQWGGVNKKKKGRLLQDKEYNEMPDIE